MPLWFFSPGTRSFRVFNSTLRCRKNVFSAEDESIARPLALLLRKLFEFLEACRVQVENKKLQLWVSWESHSYFYAVRYLNLARSQKTKRRVEWAFLSAKLTFSLDSVFKRDEYVPHLHEFERHVTKSPIRRIILILQFEQTI